MWQPMYLEQANIHHSQKCCKLRNFKLPPQCNLYLRYSGMLRSVHWQLVTDVTGQYIASIIKGHADGLFVF
jgi:hypothetical protein